MRRFVEGIDRSQSSLFPECLEDWIDEENPVRVIDVFVDDLGLTDGGFGGLYTVANLASAGVLMWAGKVADHYG